MRGLLLSVLAASLLAAASLGAYVRPYHIVVDIDNVASTGEITWHIVDAENSQVTSVIKHTFPVGTERRLVRRFLQEKLADRMAADTTTFITINESEVPATGSGAVSSVFGRTGAVTATTDDYSWTLIGSKPSTFPPDSHGHSIADSTGLQTALDGKSATGHGHTVADTTGLQTALDGKQATLGFTAENAANKNAASGYAGLTSATKLTAAQGQEVWASTDLSDFTAKSGTGTTILGATIATPATNNVLTWNGTNWINQAPAGGGESENIEKTTGDVSNSTTSFADITGLTFTAAPYTSYVFEAWLIFQSDTATTGIKFSTNGPASPDVIVVQTRIPISLTSVTLGSQRAYNTGTASASVDTINANLLAHVTGILRNGSTQGPFTIRFAAETTGIVKVMTGSILRYRAL